jgi:flagellar hook-length control protein FliK
VIGAPVIGAPPVEAAQTAAPASASKAAPVFDAILVLQSLAATAQSLDAASFEAADTADLVSAEDGDDEEDSDDLESSLAFLSALLTATAARSSPGDFETGAHGQGPADDGTAALPVKTGTGELPAGFAPNAGNDEQKSDVLLSLAAVPPEPLDIRTTTDAQNLARAAELLVQAQRAAPAAAVEQTQIATSTRDPRWAEEFGARVSLMVRAGESSASLALTPVDLGPVEVNVTVKDSQATIHFGASHAETRALIEASLPRLRELLAAQGFNLTDASVSSGFSRSQQQASSQGSRPGGDTEISITEAQAVRHLGLLDLYA